MISARTQAERPSRWEHTCAFFHIGADEMPPMSLLSRRKKETLQHFYSTLNHIHQRKLRPACSFLSFCTSRLTDP